MHLDCKITTAPVKCTVYISCRVVVRDLFLSFQTKMIHFEGKQPCYFYIAIFLSGGGAKLKEKNLFGMKYLSWKRRGLVVQGI